MKFSQRAEKLKLSSTIKIADMVRELEKSGKKIIRLETGEPHLPTPKVAKLAVQEALNQDFTHYSHSRGIYELREILCQTYNKKFGTNFDPDKNILITPGGKQALFYAIFSVIEPGDEVIIFNPAWMSYEEIVKIAGGVPVFVESEREKDFELSFDRMKKKITKKTRAIILNSPCNPTGKIIKRAVLKQINQVCLQKNTLLISDEIYDQLIFKGYNHYSVLSVNPELKNCVLVNGFSKTYAMTGWRLGYVISPPELIDVMLKFQQSTITCPTTFTQFGAVEVLKTGSDFNEQALKIYQENRDILLNEFNKMKQFKMIEPEGGLYAFVDISQASADSYNFSLDLLKRCQVSVVPGAVFGQNGEGYIRICLAADKKDILEFIKRFKQVYC